MPLKDNKIYRWIMIPFCIALCFVGKFIPENPYINPQTLQILLIFLGVLILWLTIGIDWPSLLCIFALGFVDAIGFKSVLGASFGNATFIFLLFTFICTYALSKTSFIKRITLWFINLPIAKKNGKIFSFLFLFAVLLIGLFMSPSVLFVVVLPILKEIFAIAKIEKGEKIGKALLMGLGFTVSISSGMTTIAHVFPVLAIQALGDTATNITTLTYMGFAIPTGLVLFLLMYVMLFIVYKPDTSKLKNIDTTSIKQELPKITKSDIITLVTFLIVIVLWILPDLFKEVLPDFYGFMNKLTTAMPPILGTVALCVIRVEGKPILKVDEAFKNVPWPSLIMGAATLALSSALTNKQVGIEQLIVGNGTEGLSTWFSGVGIMAVVVIFTIWALLQTNLSSNMVTATLVSSVAVGVLSAIPGIPLATIVCIIGFSASLAFATPPSMPHIAIVAGDDHCGTKEVLAFGSILMILALGVLISVGFFLGNAIFY